MSHSTRTKTQIIWMCAITPIYIYMYIRIYKDKINRICDVIPIYVYICIYEDTAHSEAGYHSFVRVPELRHICDMTFSYVYPD